MAQLKDELKKANTSEEEIEEILESQICLDTSYAEGASLEKAIKLDKKRKANKEWEAWEAWEATPRETRELYRLFEYMNRWNHARHLMEDYDEKAYNKLTIELKGMQTLLLGNTILKHDEEGYKLLSETIKDHKTLSNSDIETLKSILKKNNSIIRSDFNKYHKEDIDDFIQQVASVGMIICTGYSFYSMTNQMSINISYNPNFVKTMEGANTGQSMVTAIEWPLSLEAVGITEAEIGMLIEANKENVVAAINAITSGGGMPPDSSKTRKQALNEAKELANIPKSQNPSRQWEVGDDTTRANQKNCKYDKNSSTHGRYYEYDTPNGKRVIVDHSNDGQTHMHAGKPKGDVNSRSYDFKHERYLKITGSDGDHHIYYGE